MRRGQYQRRRAGKDRLPNENDVLCGDSDPSFLLADAPQRRRDHSQPVIQEREVNRSDQGQKPKRESERKAMATKLEHYNSFRVAARTSDSKRCTVSGASWLKELFIDFLYSQFFFARILNFAPPTTYTPLHRLLDSIDSNLQYRLSQPISYSLRSTLISPNSTSSLQIAQLSRLIRPTQLDRRVQT